MVTKADKMLAKRLLRVLRSENAPTIAEVAEQQGMGYQDLYRLLLANGYRPRRTHSMLSDQKNRRITQLLMQSNFSQRAIARMVGCAYSTVQVRSQRIRKKFVRTAETELALQDRLGHCPKHGALNVWPCVACAAEQKRASRRRRSSAMS